jgi:Na+/melibiose symporter-like transporter
MLTTSKIAIVAGPLALALLQLIGFEPVLGGDNSDAMLFALGATFVLGPSVVVLIGTWLLRDYPLDESRQAALAAAIAARHSAKSENTLGPVTR